MILQISATNGRRERPVEFLESRAVNRAFENPAIAQFWDPATDGGRAALDAMITTQAQIIAYIDDFKLLMIATLVVIPLLLVFKQASGGDGGHPVAVE